MSELPKHASPKDIEKGKKYQARYGRYTRYYKVLEINHTGDAATSTLSYVVMGGSPDDGRMGNLSLADFAQRVRYIGR